MIEHSSFGSFSEYTGGARAFIRQLKFYLHTDERFSNRHAHFIEMYSKFSKTSKLWWWHLKNKIDYAAAGITLIFRQNDSLQ